MVEKLHSELKKEFQLERLILFSDAVFAIAITLLAIEIKVPELDRHTATDKQLLESLAEMIPKFIGFFISFFIIGLYWTVHHRMFGYVINYTRKMLWLNLFFLLAVVLMPFSTAFYSVYILKLLKTPVIIYVTNIVFLGLMNLFLWLYISNPKNNLVEGLFLQERKYFSFRAIAVPIIFIVTALVYLLIAPKVAMWIPPLVPLVMKVISSRFKKRLQKKKS
jgi:uncharacterized membrane protein